MDKLKISVECYGNKYTFKVSDEITTDEIVAEFKKLMYCIGYHSDSIERAFNEEE